MLYYGSVRRVQTKYSTLYFHLLFWHFFVVFHHKFCVFIVFIYFYDEVSNFCSRISTNQKHELVFLTVSGTVSRYEDNFPTSKILVSFLFFKMVNLLQIKLWEVLQKTGRENVTKILKNIRKGWNICEIAGLTLYFQNFFVRLIPK